MVYKSPLLRAEPECGEDNCKCGMQVDAKGTDTAGLAS
jgi:hypothetical protein